MAQATIAYVKNHAAAAAAARLRSVQLRMLRFSPW
jgi:hypothetical protein